MKELKNEKELSHKELLEKEMVLHIIEEEIEMNPVDNYNYETTIYSRALYKGLARVYRLIQELKGREEV